MTDTAIETSGLTKRYGKALAVDRVDMTVHAGKVYALMGRNGAGKTSIIRMLLGLTPISDGSATVLGLDPKKDHVEIRRRTGYVPEEHHMYRWMTVREVMRFCSAFYPTWNPALCAGLLDRFNLDPNKKVKSLSKGMVAKVALTLAMAHEPRLLVLDEPTSGLDAVVRREFLESVVDVAADEGKAVLISSHLLNDVERVADCVALIDDGRIVLMEDAMTLKERMREIRVVFDGPPPEYRPEPGVLSVRSIGREWVMVLTNYSEDAMALLESKLPGASFRTRDMSLEDIFVALVRAKGDSGNG